MGVEMEKKELDAESITTVNVKDYPPSEAYTAEPPPAYHRPKSAAVQIARIAAFTVVLCSVILGAFILAAAYVNSNSACQQALNEQMVRMDELLEERAALGPQYQALVGEAGDNQEQEDQQPASQTTNSAHTTAHHKENEIHDEKEEGEETPVHLKLPLQLDLDDIAGALMAKNQKSRLNCIIEKRRADEVVDHQPRTVRLPFGLNLTTDPRYEHVSGERMAIFCESGHDQKHIPTDMQGPTIVQAVPIHIQSQPQPQPQPQPQIPPQLVLQHMHQIMMQQRLIEEQRRQQQLRVEEQQRRQQQQQMIHQQLMAQAVAAAAASQHQQEQQQQQHQQQSSPNVHFMVPLNQPEGRSFQPNGSPMSIHHIPLHGAMAVEVDARDGDQVEIEGRAMPQPPHHHNGPHQGQREAHLLPIEVIEAGPFQQHQASLQPAPAEGLRPPHERPPIYVVPQQVPQQPPQVPQQIPQQIDAEEHRPHYVQPRSVRSVRSVDDVFHKREKRMRRCACDCAC